VIETDREREAPEEFTDEELAEMFTEAENEEPYTPFFQSRGVKRFIGILLALMLCANAIAFLPQIFSLPAIRFLEVSARLSQSADIQQYKQAVVVVHSDNRKGTGFHLSSDPGTIVTNRHVVGDLPLSTVTFPDGRRYTAKVVARDPDVDLAMLRIGDETAASDLPALELSETSSGMEGKPVYIIGNPLFFNGIANEGKVGEMLEDRDPPLLSIDAPIYKGNSGSPVIAQDGRVIGVIFATSRVTANGETRNIGLAVPIEWVWKHVDSIADRSE
jgi:serine protease Do